MADHKNQHFVPKAHLRRFVENGGNSISLANIKNGKRIRGAPIKSQCSRPYFYGKDLVLEKNLQDVEGLYDQVVRDLEAEGKSSEENLKTLLLLSLMQFMRAKAMIDSSLQSQKEVFDVAFERDPRQRPANMSTEKAAAQAIGMVKSSWPYYQDLALTLLVNESRYHFFTSDNPSCRFNKFLFNKYGPDFSWGTGSAGACFLMPLTERFALFAYDSDVYAPLNN